MELRNNSGFYTLAYSGMRVGMKCELRLMKCEPWFALDHCAAVTTTFSNKEMAHQMTGAFDLLYAIFIIMECTTYVVQDELHSCFVTTILVVLFIVSFRR